MSPEQALEIACRSMGRGGTLLGNHTFHVEDHWVVVIVYRLDPLDAPATKCNLMHETRISVFIDGQETTSGIVDTRWEQTIIADPPSAADGG